ncbi:MAG: hypothetical protein VXW87_02775 [Pseudomonadota bacterium]|nr:hypothetical protein [Pseudomonadota bacterium]
MPQLTVIRLDDGNGYSEISAEVAQFDLSPQYYRSTQGHIHSSILESIYFRCKAQSMLTVSGKSIQCPNLKFISIPGAGVRFKSTDSLPKSCKLERRSIRFLPRCDQSLLRVYMQCNRLEKWYIKSLLFLLSVIHYRSQRVKVPMVVINLIISYMSYEVVASKEVPLEKHRLLSHNLVDAARFKTHQCFLRGLQVEMDHACRRSGL